MTYCVGVMLNEGLVMMSDTRTNAGVDQVASVRKMTVLNGMDDRVMVLLAAGNLATTQAVISLVSERVESREGEDSLFSTSTMFNAARLVGRTLRDVIEADGEAVRETGGDPGASFLLGGQINGRPVRLFQIYDAGNFIEATSDTPFLQIGETKYGKPVLDRTISPETPMPQAVKAALLSFDSTMRSNVSVALPIDVMTYRSDSFDAKHQFRVDENDAYFERIRRRYGQGINRLVQRIEDPDWGF